jgi:hypothetical protein
LLHKLLESRLLRSRDSAGGVIVGDLVICIVGDKAHIKWRVTTRILGRRGYTCVRVRNRLAVAAIGIAIRTHREVSKDSLVEWRFQ